MVLTRPGPRATTGLVVALGSLPLAGLALRALAGDGLGANPIEEIAHETGLSALRLLVATLAVTPLRRLTGWSWLARERRTLGLLAFAYATLHLATYAVLDVGLELDAIREDLAKRTYVVLGFATWLGLLPLAATSTRGAMRRLGRRWVTLHWLVYPCALGAVAHYLWLVKKDVRPPLAYGAVVVVLLALRLPRAPRSRAGDWLSRQGSQSLRSGGSRPGSP